MIRERNGQSVRWGTHVTDRGSVSPCVTLCLHYLAREAELLLQKSGQAGLIDRCR